MAKVSDSSTSPTSARASDATLAGSMMLCSSTAVEALGHAPRPVMTVSLTRSAKTPSKPLSSMKRTARTVELGGPASANSGYSNTSEVQLRLVSSTTSTISRGCAYANSSEKKDVVWRPCRPRTIMQSSNSSNPSSNSSQTCCMTVVSFVHPDEPSVGARRNSTLASYTSVSSDSWKKIWDSPTP